MMTRHFTRRWGFILAILRYLLIGFCALVALFSVFLVINAGYELSNPESAKTEPGVLWGLLVFFSLATTGCIYVIIRTVRKSRREDIENEERDLLKVIAERGGRITPAEIAAATNLTIAESEDKLRKLCRHGSGELQLTSDGRSVYVFFGFLSEDEKAGAKSAMDY